MNKGTPGAATGEHHISIIVPKNPFVKNVGEVSHCLCALDVQKLMEWWPGKTHSPHRDSAKVEAIQRSLDWKRVAEIAAYLLQQEITRVDERIEHFFSKFYSPNSASLAAPWPPRVPKIIKPVRSEFPTFPNVLVHINGAKVKKKPDGAALLTLNEKDENLKLSVIDGQHRINGGFLAVQILKEEPGRHEETWEIPAEVFLNLDEPGGPPRLQAQIFIDVNFNQKRVDRSLVADLFPTARSARSAIDDAERAQDIARRLMLQEGPLVGMVQIPGIRYGTKDVITLATLSREIERLLPALRMVAVSALEAQTNFLAQYLSAWLDAARRREDPPPGEPLSRDNVAYQSRVLQAVLDLAPAVIYERPRRGKGVGAGWERIATRKIARALARAGLLGSDETLIGKRAFMEQKFLGSGGIARLRNRLWAAMGAEVEIRKWSENKIAEAAKRFRSVVNKRLAAENGA